jgi:hypothetical protein
LGHQRLSLSSRLYRSINARSAIAVPDAEINWTYFWNLTLLRRRGKSPLVMESIVDGYCRSQRGVMP